MAGEFWLGNENIHIISTMPQKLYQLRIDLNDGNETKFAKYDGFYITGSSDNYRLKYGTYDETSTVGKKPFTRCVALGY